MSLRGSLIENANSRHGSRLDLPHPITLRPKLLQTQIHPKTTNTFLNWLKKQGVLTLQKLYKNNRSHGKQEIHSEKNNREKASK